MKERVLWMGETWTEIKSWDTSGFVLWPEISFQRAAEKVKWGEQRTEIGEIVDGPVVEGNIITKVRTFGMSTACEEIHPKYNPQKWKLLGPQMSPISVFQKKTLHTVLDKCKSLGFWSCNGEHCISWSAVPKAERARGQRYTF